MRKICLIVMVLGVLSCDLFGQIDSFDLSSFKQPFLDRKGLFFSPFLSIGSNNVGEYNSSSFLGSGYMSYFELSNTPNKQKSINLSQNLNIGYNFSDKISNEENTFGITSRTNADWITRKFYSPKKFIEYHHDIFLRILHENEKNEFAINDVFLTWSTTFSHGWGRVENVTDAWHAVRLLQEFRNQGLLTDNPDSLNIVLMANRIGEIKNQRVFDARLDRIYELESIENFISSQNWIEKDAGMRFFTTLYDTWVFESFTTRYSGKALKVGIKPEFTYSNDLSDSFQLNSTIAISPIISYAVYKPLSAKWQWNQNYEISYRLLKYNDETLFKYRSSTDATAEGNIGLSLGHYPNARTNYSLRTNLSLYYFDRYGADNNIDRKNWYAFHSISLNYNYFISPFTQLGITSSLSNSYRNYNIFDNKEHDWGISARVSLNHYFY